MRVPATKPILEIYGRLRCSELPRLSLIRHIPMLYFIWCRTQLVFHLLLLCFL